MPVINAHTNKATAQLQSFRLEAQGFCIHWLVSCTLGWAALIHCPALIYLCMPYRELTNNLWHFLSTIPSLTWR